MKNEILGNEYKTIIEASINKVKNKFPQLLFAGYFGALEYGNENYFVYFVFNTSEELKTAKKNGTCKLIENYWKESMLQLGYEKDKIKKFCDFASQEECNEQFAGNWYYYYK